MEVARSNVRAEALALAEAVLPSDDVAHVGPLQVEGQPAVDGGTGRDITNGEAVACDVRLAGKMSLEHPERTEDRHAGLLDLDCIARPQASVPTPSRVYEAA